MKNHHLKTTVGLAATALALMAPGQIRADYASTVLADAPKAYYRFSDSTARSLINVNSGSLGAAGNATNDLAGFVGSFTGGHVHSFPGAIAGDSDRSAFFDFTTRTEIPFNPALNPPASQAFTMEAWLYPSSDQIGNGQGVLCNRYTQGNVDGYPGPTGRQGWVMYQRAPDFSHNINAGPGVGWEFRMYNGDGSRSLLDVTSSVPYTLGQWQHVVVVYEPVTNGISNGKVSIYIDGVWAATTENTDLSALPYNPCTNDHDASKAVNGQPALALGGYNNANNDTSNFGFANPWIGAIDEFAFYSAKLTPSQILAHYQNGTNAHRSTPYAALVQSDKPVVYLRLNEVAPAPDLANNLGDLRSAGIATNLSLANNLDDLIAAGASTNIKDVKHPAKGAIAGDDHDGANGYQQRKGYSVTDLHYQSALNPNAGTPFTFELWLRPTSDRISPGAAPVNNRWVKDGNRTGWVIFQRAPDDTYAGYGPDYEGTGWNFRMYSGSGGGGQDVTTGTPWVPGQWQHLVVTWEPTTDNGDPNGSGTYDQWEGVLTAYQNGVAVAVNSSARYSANVFPTEDQSGPQGAFPSDFAVGAYNTASGLGNNSYEGDVDEVAFYSGTVLTPDQILAHYQAGTNSNLGKGYASMIFSAGAASYLSNGDVIPERVTLPTVYLRFNDAPYYGAVNSGSLGSAADGNLMGTTNNATGPSGVGYLGFESNNTALSLDGATQFANLNNPKGLQISGQITLEAWIKPAAQAGDVARIISHGPVLTTTYPVDKAVVNDDGSTNFGSSTLGTPFINAITNSSEVFLRIDSNGSMYSVGVAENDVATETTKVDIASAPIPTGDLDGNIWIHLAGTFDGINWNLFRNGTLIASQKGTFGLPAITEGDWAIGSAGEGWADAYTGGVDEVAIYDKALTPAQIGAHFVSGKTGLSSITIVTAATGQVTITWPAGTTLVRSTSVQGPYAPVPGAVSPLTLAPSGESAFYRWTL